MKNDSKKSLTVAEITGIWNTYIQDSLAICLFDYFLAKVKDGDTRTLLEYGKKLSEQHISELTTIFNEEGLPVPRGFSKEDVNINAPSLFKDDFYLWYLNGAVYLGMTAYTVILNNITRSDMIEFFSKCVNETIDLYNKDVDLLTTKGIFIDAPKVEVTKENSLVKDKDFLGSWFGESRTMLAREATAIYANIVYNIVSRTLFTGFGQVASNKEVRDYLFEGRGIVTKQIKGLSEMLSNENIPVPSTSDSFLTDSTTAPFSDKLMMFVSIALSMLTLSNSRSLLIYTFRKDIQVGMLKNIAESTKFTADGLKIMIENGWMEQPPQIVKNEELSKC